MFNTAFRHSKKRYLNRVGKVVAVSQFVADHSGVADCEVVPTFVDDTRIFGNFPTPPYVPTGDYILYVGALSREKGVHVLLDAYACLEEPKPQLLVLGVPGKVAVTGPGVHVATNVPKEEVWAAYSRALFSVVPSIWPDPFPQVAIESRLLGCPIIACRSGGLTAAVENGRTGLAVSPNSVEELTAAMTRLIHDHSLRESLSAGGKEYAKRFTISNVGPQLEQVLEDLAAP